MSLLKNNLTEKQQLVSKYLTIKNSCKEYFSSCLKL